MKVFQCFQIYVTLIYIHHLWKGSKIILFARISHLKLQCNKNANLISIFLCNLNHHKWGQLKLMEISKLGQLEEIVKGIIPLWPKVSSFKNTTEFLLHARPVLIILEILKKTWKMGLVLVTKSLLFWQYIFMQSHAWI